MLNGINSHGSDRPNHPQAVTGELQTQANARKGCLNLCNGEGRDELFVFEENHKSQFAKGTRAARKPFIGGSVLAGMATVSAHVLAAPLMPVVCTTSAVAAFVAVTHAVHQDGQTRHATKIKDLLNVARASAESCQVSAEQAAYNMRSLELHKPYLTRGNEVLQVNYDHVMALLAHKANGEGTDGADESQKTNLSDELIMIQNKFCREKQCNADKFDTNAFNRVSTIAEMSNISAELKEFAENLRKEIMFGHVLHKREDAEAHTSVDSAPALSSPRSSHTSEEDQSTWTGLPGDAALDEQQADETASLALHDAPDKIQQDEASAGPSTKQSVENILNVHT